jgi:hypothetical protein
VTARGHDPAKRRDARIWKRARRMATQSGLPLKRAEAIVRSNDTRLDLLDRGELTLAQLVAATRAEIRKMVHDTRAVRS